MPDQTPWPPTGSAASPLNLVTAAGATVLANKLAAGDANPDFDLRVDAAKGPIFEWGLGGGNAVDANLYRVAAGVLGTDGAFQIANALGRISYNGTFSAISFPGNVIAPGGNIYARQGAATEVQIGVFGALSGISFGQGTLALYGGIGAPANANGNNGDIYLRSDGAALTTIYQKRAGAWVGIV